MTKLLKLAVHENKQTSAWALCGSERSRAFFIAGCEPYIVSPSIE